MNIHEYQAKALLKTYGIPVPMGAMASSIEEIDALVNSLDFSTWVVKAQVHAGGRGKAGGIKVVQSKESALLAAKEMLGSVLVTKQTGAQGKQVRKIYIEQGVDIASELYLSVLLDREKKAVTFVASNQGGVNIEEVAQNTPDAVHKVVVDPATHIKPFHCRKLAVALGLAGELYPAFQDLCVKLYELLLSTDASMIELNPLVITKTGALIPIDAKMSFDNNALFRHPEIAQLDDPEEKSSKELAAKEIGINYIELDGDIGIILNGAGLAMATLDIVKQSGGEPANFSDMGGTASMEQVISTFNLVHSSPSVKAIFIYIFGGIIRCDMIAKGILDAAGNLQSSLPIVMCLKGTNSEEGRAMIQGQSAVNITMVDSLKAGAEKVVELTNGAQS